MERQPETASSSDRELTIVLQRHGMSYKNGMIFSKNMDELGLLTTKGVETTKQKSALAIESILQGNKNEAIDFIFLNSPARYEGIYGQRARHTAQVSAQQIPIVDNRKLRIIELEKTRYLTRDWQPLNEFHLDSTNSDMLEIKYNEDFWELYYNMSPQLQELGNRNILSETSKEIAARVKYAFRTLHRFWQNYKSIEPNKKLVIWGTTHGDILRSFIQHGMEAGDSARDWRADYSETFEFSVSDKGLCTLRFKGDKYSINL